MIELTSVLQPAPVPSRDWALFLDFDGTLVEIAEHPEAIQVPSDLPDLLRRIGAGLGGALAVVSGRPVAQIDRYLHTAVPYVAGLHGLEFRANGTQLQELPPPNGELSGLRADLERFVEAHPGLLLEDKRASVVLHYRQRPELAETCRATAQAAVAPYAGRLEVLDGKMVFEIKPSGIDKGEAVCRFLAMPPFRGRRPVFIGDDITDEHGFEAVNGRGGHSIVVGDRRPTAARTRIASVAELFAWLRALPELLG